MLAVVIAFVVLAVGEALPTYAQQDAEIDFDGCGNGWECGTLTVPLDYNDPGGRTIEIAVSRLPADDGDDRIGVLMTNPGGPGAGGIGFARAWARLLDDDVRDHFDIVAFDPRGTGSSAPVECSEHLVDLFGVDQSPDNEEEFQTLLDLYEDYAAACRAEYGDVLDYLGTRNVARDMDRIRAALGEEQVNFVGYSYGTRIGSVYADLFPERVRAFVLDGAVDNALTSEEAALEQAAGFERALNNFLDSCERRDCSLADDGDPADAIAGLLEQAEEAPIPAPGMDRDARPGEVTLGIVLGLYDELTWPLLESALAAAIHGNASQLVTLADTYLGVASTAVLNAVNCADSPPPVDSVDTYEEYLEALPAYEAAAPTFGPTVVIDSCQYWAGSDPIGVPDATGAPPIIVLGTTGDPATPYEWAEALADQLKSGVLLRHEGEGHTVYGGGGSECVDDIVNDYLVELVVPVSGTSCAGDEAPVIPAGATTTPDIGVTPTAVQPIAVSPTPGPPDTGAPGDSSGPGVLSIALVIAASTVVAVAALAFALWRRG